MCLVAQVVLLLLVQVPLVLAAGCRYTLATAVLPLLAWVVLVVSLVFTQVPQARHRRAPLLVPLVSFASGREQRLLVTVRI